jgi:hypothetical protein
MPRDTVNGERRQSLRVLAAGLYVVYSIIPEELVEETRRSVLSQTLEQDDLQIESDKLWHTNDIAEKMDDQFSELRRFLRQIDSKLDYLIQIAEGRKPNAIGEQRTVRLLDVSGGGLAFLSKTDIPIGTMLYLRLQLSRFPMLEISATARVARTQQITQEMEATTDSKFEIGTSFDTVQESDQERLYRFISRLERHLLRERKETKNS